MTKTERCETLTDAALGLIIREATNRAANFVRLERFVFEREPKCSYDGTLTDLVTSADRAAQAAILGVLQTTTPSYGIVAEEEDLRIEPKESSWPKRYWIVDPLDGTKAFGRMQSHGIGTMIALLEEKHVISVCIEDVMTGEIYYFRPGSYKVHRMDRVGARLRLDLLDPTRPLSDQYLLVRKNPWEFAPAIRQKFIPRADRKQNLFKDFEIEGGSIGLSFARLWKGEIGGVLLLGNNPNQPWDWAPVMGISERLGYVPLRLEIQDDRILKALPYTIDIYDVQAPGCPILIVHQTHIQTVSDWFHCSQDHDA
ncbi:MAG: Inositol monophosphatase [Candidatus Uhrbacteria bacterium GW2011_GWE2_46_68]|uniref:Inositol monophosphatase n=2 Tax=Candidatus Uhriibacteriota TaxID=1752732 RepID=A0A0G1T7G5_9BACT|nr:MAG: Inositol monophosphatase [Candidatus Uhrbacteria bacterium GW2011_GWF2_46_218]KKU41370.1 MAG: Inositol monophosphatase [Candidatus Uhrbacteria bacterium GW2011_GWE2_46_68]